MIFSTLNLTPTLLLFFFQLFLFLCLLFCFKLFCSLFCLCPVYSTHPTLIYAHTVRFPFCRPVFQLIYFFFLVFTFLFTLSVLFISAFFLALFLFRPSLLLACCIIQMSIFYVLCSLHQLELSIGKWADTVSLPFILILLSSIRVTPIQADGVELTWLVRAYERPNVRRVMK